MNLYQVYESIFPKEILRGRVSMENKKIIIAAAAATVCAAGLTAAAVIVCKRLFEKTYFSVN